MRGRASLPQRGKQRCSITKRELAPKRFALLHFNLFAPLEEQH